MAPDLIHHNVRQRNSSFELLRLVLMFMIIIHHSVCFGLGLVGLRDASPGRILLTGSDMPFYMLVNCLCICAVNCFIVISGYFSIKVSASKVKKLLFAVLFYTILFSTIPNLINGEMKDAAFSLLFLSHTSYWFITNYLFLMVFAPAINLMFERMSKHQVTIFLICLFVMTGYFGFIWGNYVNYNGYTLFQFILMYSIGRYIKCYDVSLSKAKCVAGYLFSTVTCAVCMWGVYRIGGGNSDYAWRVTYYNNPLLVMAAVCVFLLFKNFNMNSKLVNSISASALAIYLFQSSPIIGKLLYGTIADCYTSNPNKVTVLLIIIALAFAVMVFALLFDRIRLYISNMILKK